MNEPGEPNMGNPSVRFDEGRERVGHWPCASQSVLPAYSTCFKAGKRIGNPELGRGIRFSSVPPALLNSAFIIHP